MIGIKNTLDETITVSADSDDRLTHTLNAIQVIHPIQNQDYVAVPKTRVDTIMVGDSNKHDIYWSGSQWYCNNCNEYFVVPLDVHSYLVTMVCVLAPRTALKCNSVDY